MHALLAIQPRAAAVFFAVCLWASSFPSAATVRVRPSDKCTTVIVGKNATFDGSVLLAHNEDWGEYPVALRWTPRETHAVGDVIQLHGGQTVPQVAETFAFLSPAATCNGINEFQVMITDNTGSCRKEIVRSPTGIDMDELVAITLQQSRTSREAIETMGRLIDRCGYKSIDGPDGDIFSVADPKEGWWMEVTSSGQWVAQRVPDDAFVIIANQFRISTVDLRDSSRFLACSNLVDYAIGQGWYKPSDGPFQFSRAYSLPGHASARRQWRGNTRLGGKSLDPEDQPLAVVPARKLQPQDLIAFLRDHFEGTEFDLTKGYKTGSPHHTAERGICRMSTDASTVAHLRSWLPPEIGGLLWFSVGTPCSSVYVPLYLGVTDFPKPYASIPPKFDRENAFWTFNSLENLVDQYYADQGTVVGASAKKDAARSIDFVAAFWQKVETEAFAMQPAVEKTALELMATDKALARSFLTKYYQMLAWRSFQDAQELTDHLRTLHDR